jgi:hypothetical protein
MRDDDTPSGESGMAGMAGLDIFGEYGVTSHELPAVPAPQRARWDRERQEQWRLRLQARERIIAKLAKLARQRTLSAPVYDWLQDELAAGYLPDVYRDEGGRWWVYSEFNRWSYSLAGFARCVQTWLPLSERATEIVPTPHVTPLATPHAPPLATPPGLPWHPAYNSRLTPPPQLRQPPLPAGLSVGFGAPAPATRPILQENNEKRGLC